MPQTYIEYNALVVFIIRGVMFSLGKYRSGSFFLKLKYCSVINKSEQQ